MVRKFLIGLIRIYQRWISPMLPKACIYEPTCSEYTAQAIRRHGVLYGCVLGGWRILRCHPFARGGWDPVPGAMDADKTPEPETEPNQDTAESVCRPPCSACSVKDTNAEAKTPVSEKN